MKYILFILFIFLIGCTKPEIPFPQVMANDDIFSVKESSVSNGQSIHFTLPSKGTYTLSLIDKENNKVISRERFIGQNGENIKKIYTKSLQSKYLYLVLVDSAKTELNRTTIIIN